MSVLTDKAKVFLPSQLCPECDDHQSSRYGMIRNVHLEHAIMSFSQTLYSPAHAFRPWPFRIAVKTVVPPESIGAKPLLIDEVAESEEGVPLPVEPDEGTPPIPDDERVLNVPS